MKKLVCFALYLALAGCATSTTLSEDEATSQPEFADEYLIGSADTLSVNVYRNDDLSVTVPVRPDGYITVPVAGDIRVGGLSPERVSQEIAKALANYIRDPVVTTTVVGLGSNEYLSRVRVTGAVNAPASLPYRSGMTVMDVVLDAGGLSEFANASRASLYRGEQKIRLRLDRILNKGDMTTNYDVRPGDIITIPERLF